MCPTRVSLLDTLAHSASNDAFSVIRRHVRRTAREIRARIAIYYAAHSLFKATEICGWAHSFWFGTLHHPLSLRLFKGTLRFVWFFPLRSKSHILSQSVSTTRHLLLSFSSSYSKKSHTGLCRFLPAFAATAMVLPGDVTDREMQ